MVTAADIMTRDVISVRPDAPLREALFKLIEYTFRRFLIVEGKKVVGIVARRDLLREVARFYGED